MAQQGYEQVTRPPRRRRRWWTRRPVVFLLVCYLAAVVVYAVLVGPSLATYVAGTSTTARIGACRTETVGGGALRRRQQACAATWTTGGVTHRGTATALFGGLRGGTAIEVRATATRATPTSTLPVALLLGAFIPVIALVGMLVGLLRWLADTVLDRATGSAYARMTRPSRR